MSLILWSVTLPYWLVMEIENLLGWEHTLQISNQLIFCMLHTKNVYESKKLLTCIYIFSSK
jgi:hypothetical protein